MPRPIPPCGYDHSPRETYIRGNGQANIQKGNLLIRGKN